MKKTSFLLLLVLAYTAVNAQLKLIPWPLSVSQTEQTMALPADITIGGNKYFNETFLQLKELIAPYFNSITFSSATNKSTISFSKQSSLLNLYGEEGYELQITGKQITIKSATSKGAFYAAQTLAQIIRQSVTGNEKKAVTLQGVIIKDKPAFVWRSFMLDEARYFKGEAVVKKLIDNMAALKLNVFHWHLTDDQGWRIEIKKYPRLTSVGSKRENSQTGGWNSKTFSGKPHEGFYTQQQIKDLVAYAAKKNITIVPEIEMPGHNAAAIAAYPNLGTVKDSIKVPTVFGKHVQAIDVSDPKVIQFYEDVLTEVIALFPSKVIHIGGDEVNFSQWMESSKVQAYMKEKGLKTPADLQIYFTNQISRFIDSKNRTMMGWNDILGGNIHDWQDAGNMKVSESLAPNTIVHFWKGDKQLLENAIKRGYKIVNSEHSFTYLDYNYNNLSLSKAYGFKVMPEGLTVAEQKQIIGLGCQMWGEWTPDITTMNNQIFPRIAAYAEAGWTSESNKNYKRFKETLIDLFKPFWEKQGIYSSHIND